MNEMNEAETPTVSVYYDHNIISGRHIPATSETPIASSRLIEGLSCLGAGSGTRMYEAGPIGIPMIPEKKKIHRQLTQCTNAPPINSPSKLAIAAATNRIQIRTATCSVLAVIRTCARKERKRNGLFSFPGEVLDNQTQCGWDRHRGANTGKATKDKDDDLVVQEPSDKREPAKDRRAQHECPF